MTLQEAIEIVSMMTPVRSYDGTGGLWFGSNQNMADATFEDWGAARATSIILNAVQERTLSDHRGCHDEINLLRQVAKEVIEQAIREAHAEREQRLSKLEEEYAKLAEEQNAKTEKSRVYVDTEVADGV